MLSRRIQAPDQDLLHPDFSGWDQAEPLLLPMETPPIGNAPSNYFRAMDPAKVGAVKQLTVGSLHNGEALFFRLLWQNSDPRLNLAGLDEYRDGAGVLFPFLEDAKFQSMGSLNQPVNAWCWQAGIEAPFNVTAAGLGTTRREEQSYLLARPLHRDGMWRLVIARPFSTPEPDRNVALAPGLTKKVGFAVWTGSNRERAGAKSYCGNWQQVEIEP